METIYDLIKDQCPSGVEWVRLGDACNIKRGVRVTKKDLLIDGIYPVVSGGIGYMGYINDWNRQPNTITIAQYGTAGYVGWQDKKFWANDVCYTLDFDTNRIVSKYLYHCLTSKQDDIYAMSNRSAVPYSISKEKLKEILIPLPPLPIQSEIVRILDAFFVHELEIERKLEQELELRRKRREFYRDKLLSFEEFKNLNYNTQLASSENS